MQDRLRGHSSWLEVQRSGLDSRRYLIFWEVVGLELGPLSVMSTIYELLERQSSGSGLESREYGRRGPSGWPRGPSPQSTKIGTIFAGRYSSLADSDHGFFFLDAVCLSFTDGHLYFVMLWSNLLSDFLLLSSVI
jgi:hypothetical protein